MGISGNRSGNVASRWRSAGGRLGVAVAAVAVIALAGCGSSSKTTSSTTAAPSSTSSTTTGSSTSGGAGSISIADGVSITPAPGWSVVQHQSTSLSLANKDQTVFYFVTVGKSSASDATSQLQQDIQADSDPANGNKDYHNVQVQGTPQNDPPSDTTKFDQGASAQFTATDSQDQPVTGVYGELFSTTSGNSVFISAWAADANTLNQAQSDLKEMNKSLES
jgi:hypothetical protein